MDELSLLRRIRTDVPEAEQNVLDRGRAALLERAQLETGPTVPQQVTRRRHPVRWAGIGVLAAGALTVALVATNVLGFGSWHGATEPAAAAAVLEAAAIQTSDLEVKPGQYLLVETEAVYRNLTENASGELVGYFTMNRDYKYVPADRSDEWVWDRPLAEFYEADTPEGEAMGKEETEWQNEGRTPELLRAANAEFYGPSSRPDYETLPKDPRQLLDYIHADTAGTGSSVDASAFEWIRHTLITAVLSADARASLYKTTALIPGVEVTERVANINGQEGIAIGRKDSIQDIRYDLIINPDTGALIGERQVQLVDGFGSLAGTMTSFTAIQSSVVDSVPEGGTKQEPFDVGVEACTQKNDLMEC